MSAPATPHATTGYSDGINHALAFAAKHHDRQVRKGTRLPYLTHAANMAIILTRYGCEDETVIAGILHDVVEDCVRDGWTQEMLDERIASKFGAGVLATVLEVTKRRVDDGGIDLSREEVRADYLMRLADAGEAARWVCAADKVHMAGTILADLRRTIDPDTVWGRFTGGRDATIGWFRAVSARFQALGFDRPICIELTTLIAQIDAA